MNQLPDIVIGSGPAGVSVAAARLAKGKSVLMLDRGEGLNAKASVLRDDLASKGLANWTASDITKYQNGQFTAPEGAIRKFGSDFAITLPETLFDQPYPWLGLRSSSARGGLSNLWGASVLPSRQSDMENWPIKAADLSDHYKAVADFMPVAGRKDVIQDVYPDFPMDGRTTLPVPAQAAKLLRKADRKPNPLPDMWVGAARNAVDTKCTACGMCLHGCPWDHIWTSRLTVDRLNTKSGFRYKGGVNVVSVSQSGGHAQVRMADGSEIEGARVFVATGVLETARLYLTSFSALEHLMLLDSQHFFTPFLHRWKISTDPETTRQHTLSAAFVEFPSPQNDQFSHAQLYMWNENYKREMMQKYGRRLPGSAPVFAALSKRLIVAQSFLHSDFSSRIQLGLAADGTRLSAEHLPSDKTAPMIKATRKHLAKGLNKLGLTALSFAGHAGSPGSSFHVGGSLPMAEKATGAQTDRLGRLEGIDLVHAVDASVMSSIPASTITFTVMANAHRIGTEAP